MKISREHLHARASATYAHTVEQLGKAGGPGACAAVARRLAAVLDGALADAQAGGAGVACASGCTFCCHLRVSVFPHEARALLAHLRTRLAPAAAASIERRILANAARIGAMTAAQHYAARLPCALLTDGRCSAYEVRPSACAAHHSLSRERCEHGFNHPEGSGTPSNSRPAVLGVQVLGDALIAATQSALDELGLPTARLELHEALGALIEARDES